jgi:hypothetical protein
MPLQCPPDSALPPTHLGPGSLVSSARCVRRHGETSGAAAWEIAAPVVGTAPAAMHCAARISSLRGVLEAVVGCAPALDPHPTAADDGDPRGADLTPPAPASRPLFTPPGHTSRWRQSRGPASPRRTMRWRGSTPARRPPRRRRGRERGSVRGRRGGERRVGVADGAGGEGGAGNDDLVGVGVGIGVGARRRRGRHRCGCGAAVRADRAASGPSGQGRPVAPGRGMAPAYRRHMRTVRRLTLPSFCWTPTASGRMGRKSGGASRKRWGRPPHGNPPPGPPGSNTAQKTPLPMTAEVPHGPHTRFMSAKHIHIIRGWCLARQRQACRLVYEVSARLTTCAHARSLALSRVCTRPGKSWRSLRNHWRAAVG